ncbi:MAG: hypothetical protein ACOWWM_16675 [Desulfobacterales bacterium]
MELSTYWSSIENMALATLVLQWTLIGLVAAAFLLSFWKKARRWSQAAIVLSLALGVVSLAAGSRFADLHAEKDAGLHQRLQELETYSSRLGVRLKSNQTDLRKARENLASLEVMANDLEVRLVDTFDKLKRAKMEVTASRKQLDRLKEINLASLEARNSEGELESSISAVSLAD